MDAVAAEGGVAVFHDRYSGSSIGEDVVVLECAQAVLVDKNATCPTIVDAVAAEGGVTTFFDYYSGQSIGEDVVVLECAQTVLVDKNATCPTIVDAVAAEAWVCPPVDGNTGQALTCYVAIFQLQSPLGNVYAIPLPVPHLSECQVCDSAHSCLEEQNVHASRLHDDFPGLAITDDLERLVNG